MPPSPEILHDLRDAYATGNLIVFAGAGIPKAAGLPDWPTLAQNLRDRLLREARPADVLAEVDDLLKQRKLIDALSAIKLPQALGDHEGARATQPGWRATQPGWAGRRNPGGGGRRPGEGDATR
jgi:hypothetical protein